MASAFIDPRGLRFLLHDWLHVGALTRHPRYADHSIETFDAMLELSRRLAEEKFATHYKKSDRVEPTLVDGKVTVIPEIAAAIRAYAEAGLSAASFSPDHGGLGLPHVVEAASMAHFMAANVATAAYPMLTAGNARVLVRFGSPAQIEAFALPEIEGRWLGTMCLSEPQAGSSLADIATRAAPCGDDELGGEDELGPRYRLTGNKMWISGGDHDITPNIVHLVLAKIPGPDGRLPAGTGGITLFIVPKILPDGTPNDIVVAGLNHKMGYRGTTNCLLNFGERDGATGWRLGEPGQGLAIMFHMMNEARIMIGLGAASLACRGYRQSLDYARERRQGRIARDPSRPQAPIIAHADVRRMLLAQKALAEGALALVLYCALLIDEERVLAPGPARDAVSARLGLLTPVAKSWPSEFGLVANDLAIQIHGGYGYTRDFDVEQIWRDNRLNPIHEGTAGIQAIDLLGRKLLRDRAAALDELGLRVAETIARAADNEDLAPFAARLNESWRRLRETVATLLALDDPARALDNASAFLSAFGHTVVAWLWLDQAAILRDTADAEPDWRDGKLRACRYFFEIELPKSDSWLTPVANLCDVAATMPEEWF